MAQSSFNDILNLPSVSADKTLAYGDSNLQQGEYWHAKNSSTLIVLIHGGCWLNSYDKQHVRALASSLNRAGYAVWSIEYRRLGDEGGGWPGTFEDAIAGVNASQQFGIKNIILLGHSAGGQLALWLGANSRLPADSIFKDKLKVSLSAVIGLAAIPDMAEYAKGQSGCERAARDLMGGTANERPDHYQQASPEQLASAVPVILIHGTADGIVPISQSEQFVISHPETRLVKLEGAGHFDLINTTGAGFRKILEAINSIKHE